MKAIIINKASLPVSSLLYTLQYNYVDAYSTVIEDPGNKIQIEDIAKNFFSSSPQWVELLFRLRNALVRLIKLKTPKENPRIAGAKFEPGERFGLFKVFARNEHEIILGEDDAHLDFKVSLHVTPSASFHKTITFSTIVIIHNRFGRIYFWLIKPFHKQVVKVILKRVAKQLIKG